MHRTITTKVIAKATIPVQVVLHVEPPVEFACCPAREMYGSPDTQDQCCQLCHLDYQSVNETLYQPEGKESDNNKVNPVHCSIRLKG